MHELYITIICSPITLLSILSIKRRIDKLRSGASLRKQSDKAKVILDYSQRYFTSDTSKLIGQRYPRLGYAVNNIKSSYTYTKCKERFIIIA